MKTIAFVARKGGVSKTTLAAHLAVFASATQPVTIIDLDPQGSLALWWNDREAPSPSLMDAPIGKLAGELAAVKDDPGIVVIDTPAMDSTLTSSVIQLADLVIIPVKASPHDLRGVAVTVAEAKRQRKPFLFVLTQAIAGAALTSQAQARLAESGSVVSPIMVHRVSYAGSMVDGRTVFELEPHSRASLEIQEICKAIFAELWQTSVKKKGK